MDLHEKRCIPCEGGIPPLTHEDIEPLFSNLDQAWEVVDAHHLQRTWSFEDFSTLH